MLDAASEFPPTPRVIVGLELEGGIWESGSKWGPGLDWVCPAGPQARPVGTPQAPNERGD